MHPLRPLQPMQFLPPYAPLSTPLICPACPWTPTLVSLSRPFSWSLCWAFSLLSHLFVRSYLVPPLLACSNLDGSRRTEFSNPASVRSISCLKHPETVLCFLACRVLYHEQRIDMEVVLPCFLVVVLLALVIAQGCCCMRLKTASIIFKSRRSGLTTRYISMTRG